MYMFCDEVRGKKKTHFTLIIMGNRNLNEKLGVCTAFESSARKGIIQLFFFFLRIRTIQLNMASMRVSLKLTP